MSTPHPALRINDDVLGRIREYVGINPLLNTCRGFSSSKKRLFYWKLNRTYSIKYHDDGLFRATLLSLMLERKNQLALKLSNCDNVSDVSALANVHALNLSSCNNVRDVSALANVHTLDLSWCVNVSDVSALANVHTLDLSYCRNVRDVSALGNVHSLSLSGCNIISRP